MLAWREYKASLCDGCGQPKALAHHSDNAGGWYGVSEPVECYACTALERAKHPDAKEPVKPVAYLSITHDRDYREHPLPPLT